MVPMDFRIEQEFQQLCGYMTNKEASKEADILESLEKTVIAAQDSLLVCSGSKSERFSVENLAGTVFAQKYEILEMLGKGGMSVVYRARHIVMNKIEAIKILQMPSTADPDSFRRFKLEAQTTSKLNHPNIVTVHDCASEGSWPYLVMDFVEGKTLAELLAEEGPFSAARFLSIMQQVAAAMAHAHDAGVVHRDLKPSNVMISKGAEQVKILDFGIAKLISESSSEAEQLTKTGTILGSIPYMSPEQCSGNAVDRRSDIYSLGCLMYELLSGKKPYQGNSEIETILNHINEAPPAIAAPCLDDKTKKRLELIVLRCLAKRQADRYQSMAEVESELRSVSVKSESGFAAVLGSAWVLACAKYRAGSKKLFKVVILTIIASLFFAGMLIAWFHNGEEAARNDHLSGQQQKISLVQDEQPRVEMYKGKTLAQWSNAIENSPDDPSLYFSRGMLHAMRDERSNAIEDYSRAIELKPDYLEAFQGRSYEYIYNVSYDKAEQDANKAIELGPGSSESYFCRAKVCQSLERYDESITACRKAIAIESRAKYHYLLAQILIKLARYDEADSEVKTAIVLESTHPSLMNDAPKYRGVAGFIATISQDFSGALKELKQATESPAASGVVWQELAYCYVCLGQKQEVERAIQQAKTRETFPARAYRVTGEVYRTAGSFEKAIREFNASTSLEEYPPGFRERAVVYIRLGQWRSAYDDLKKSLRLNPYSMTTRSYLALVENHLGMKQKASEDIAAVFKAKEIPPIVYANKAEIELNDGRYDSALTDANTALVLDPFLKEGYAVRARIHQRLNDSRSSNADQSKSDTLVSHLDL